MTGRFNKADGIRRLKLKVNDCVKHDSVDCTGWDTRGCEHLAFSHSVRVEWSESQHMGAFLYGASRLQLLLQVTGQRGQQVSSATLYLNLKLLSLWLTYSGWISVSSSKESCDKVSHSRIMLAGGNEDGKCDQGLVTMTASVGFFAL